MNHADLVRNLQSKFKVTGPVIKESTLTDGAAATT